MATVLLASAGASAAQGLGLGAAGALAGKALGSYIGGRIDDKIFGPRRLPDVEGARLEELAVQTSTYGKMIPIVYGNVRIGGNIIWSRPIKETATTQTNSQSGGKGGGGSVTQKQTSYTYSASLAIAICEGEIDNIVKVWADSKIIDSSQGTYRFYKGTEDQIADSFIESFEGSGKTPAYRGTAYVVIEDFPLADFGNRIPNFTFEVKRKLRKNDAEEVENNVRSVMMIPGSGEFVYDTDTVYKIPGYDVGNRFVQNGSKTAINVNNHSEKTDSMLALDQLESELPNLEYVSVLVGWFGNSIDASNCTILPGVEYNTGSQTSAEQWSVAGFNRSSAHQITKLEESPVYGGTPDDQSLIRYVDELKSRGYKVVFYPFIFMDMDGKPWRGRIADSAANIPGFFTKTNGYNDFIEHYIGLLDGKVDAFCIGSEMVGLTTVRENSDNSFPAVDELVNLAATAKTSLGSSVKITYASDWSEYHHNEDGWYHMDKLWASSNIDVIGIDAYFPLTDEVQNGYDRQKIIDGWTSGEGYDWYYTDAARTTKANLQPKYAWKNIEWFWKNDHVNPDLSATDWVPESKKIWFTEFGFPSVDGCANQPNVFYDPNSSESAFPYHSRGRVDFRAQRLAIEATYEVWKDSAMVGELFLWTWDARPYPYFPDLRNVWADGGLWLYGHWVNGKMGLSALNAIIEDITNKVGLDPADLVTDSLVDLVDGFVINNVMSARQALEQLQKAYFFDVAENDNLLEFVPRGQDSIEKVSDEFLIPQDRGEGSKLLEVKVRQELELPKKVDVSYIDRILDYQQGNQHSQRAVTNSREKLALNVPVVLNEWQARRIAEVALYNSWLSRTTYDFSLPIKFGYLEPTDVIEIETEEHTHRVRISEALFGNNGEIKIQAVAEDAEIYDFYSEPIDEGSTNEIEAIASTRAEFLDLPALPNDSQDKAYLRVAANGLGDNWSGAVIYRSDDGGDNYDSILDIQTGATIGETMNVLSVASADIWDKSSKLQVALLSGELEARTELAVLNGANVAVVGNEIIQFKSAILTAENTYEISGLLRGRLGTEHEIENHALADRFVLLDSAVEKDALAASLFGMSKSYKNASLGQKLSNVTEEDFTFKANGLKPYSPVHIEASRDDDGNVAISWIRRTRINGGLRDAVDVPISEQEEKYEIEIFDGEAVVRVTESATANIIYLEAQQIEDFGIVQSAVEINIYQISAIVGRGYPANITI